MIEALGLVDCIRVVVIQILDHSQRHVFVPGRGEYVLDALVAGKLGQEVRLRLDDENRLLDFGIDLGEIQGELLSPVLRRPIVHDAAVRIDEAGQVRGLLDD